MNDPHIWRELINLHVPTSALHQVEKFGSGTVGSVGMARYTPERTANGSFSRFFVEDDTLGNVLVWFSYRTLIAKCAVDHNNATLITHYSYSNTTSRHRNAIAIPRVADQHRTPDMLITELEIDTNGPNRVTPEAIVECAAKEVVQNMNAFKRVRDYHNWSFLTVCSIRHLHDTMRCVGLGARLPKVDELYSRKTHAKMVAAYMQDESGRVAEAFREYRKMTNEEMDND